MQIDLHPDCNICETIFDTLSLNFQKNLSITFTDLEGFNDLGNYELNQNTTIFDDNENIFINNDSIVYNNIPEYNYADTDILPYTIFNQNGDTICTSSIVIDILCPPLYLNNSLDLGECNDTLLRLSAYLALESISPIKVDYTIKQDTTIILQETNSVIGDITLSYGNYTFEMLPVGMNTGCSFTKEFNIEKCDSIPDNTTQNDTLQNDINSIHTAYIDPYSCSAYINILSNYTTLNSIPENIYTINSDGPYISDDACEWLQTDTSIYYQCRIDLEEGDTEPTVYIFNNLTNQDTSYTISNFYCSSNLADNIVVMPNPNDGAFKVQLLNVPENAKTTFWLYDTKGRLLLLSLIHISEPTRP